MAYKDEFEVARLMTNTAFNHQIVAEFEGDYTVKYHLAPPLLSHRKDTRGRPLKRAYGPWLKPMLGYLAKCKRWRSSRFNIFAYHTEARMHRDLLSWFETALDQVGADFSPDQQNRCLSILTAPMEIRGYGPVRLQAAEKVLQSTNAELAALK